MKIYDIPKSGKIGNIVWQRNRYRQYSYPAFVEFNTRSPAQCTIRQAFAAVSKRWRTLTQEQRDAWIAVAWNKWSKPRFFQRGRLTGCQLFVKTNVTLVHRGKPQVDLPTEGRSKNEECRNMTPKAVPGLLGGVFVSKRDTGSRGDPLKIPCLHRGKTIPTRSQHAGRSLRPPMPARAASLPLPVPAACLPPAGASEPLGIIPGTGPHTTGAARERRSS